MAEIQEIPLDAVEAPEAVPEVGEIPEIEAPAPKKRGRPPGSVNKKPKAAPAPPPAPKAKPKAKRKADGRSAPARSAVPPSPDETSEEDTPPPRARRSARSTPEPLDRRALAADVLGLLQEQRMSRGMARRNHYASWFQNM